MSAYYNELDPKAAAWLRQLIKKGLIANGEVDERSITEVEPSDLRGFTQHHFFAGVAGWSYALRLAGWGDDRSVVTASLPCQPFSVAGAGKGINDERHLLPHFIELVKQCNFKTIFGEQVPGAIKHGWLDDLYNEMERENYAVGSIVLTAAGAGSAQIRQRLYWVADSISERPKEQPGNRGILRETLGNDARESIERSGGLCGLSNTENQRYQRQQDTTGKAGRIGVESVGGEWSNPEWLYCRDNKYRPIKPGIKPLVNGFFRGMGYSSDPGEPINTDNTQEARVMRLKGYGNAIVPQVAAQFIRAFTEIK
jgi:DNA (cytosine-5)-methyltransferase 1